MPQVRGHEWATHAVVTGKRRTDEWACPPEGGLKVAACLSRIYHAAMKIYGTGIHIESKAGMQPDNAQDLNGAAASDYIEHVEKCLNRLMKTSVGRTVIGQMNSSGHVCTIFAAPDTLTSDQNVAKQNPASIASEIASLVKPFRPFHKNLKLNQKGLNGAKTKAQTSYKTALAKLGFDQKKADLAPELLTVLMRATAKYPNPLVHLPGQIGVSQEDFVDMCTGEKAFPDNAYFKLCFLLYDYMSPGPGSPTYVRFQSYDSFTSSFKADHKTENKSRPLFDTKSNLWRDLAATILGHELIHAWRMMRGRRVVLGGAWEEEAMTTGIGPFTNWKLTENAIRRELGLTQRMTYQSGQCSSFEMQNVMVNTNALTYTGAYY